MLGRRIGAGEVVDHDLRQLGSLSSPNSTSGRCRSRTAPRLRPAESETPRPRRSGHPSTISSHDAALVDRAEHQMIAFALQRADQAIDHFGVDAFEDPGVVGIEQADAVGAAAGKGPRPADWVGNPSRWRVCRISLGGLGAAPMRLANVAAKNSGDGRTRHARTLRDLVNRYRHRSVPLVDLAFQCDRRPLGESRQSAPITRRQHGVSAVRINCSMAVVKSIR